ncbi:tetratricopeptide repeat protein, partial [Thiothrix subterranea]
TLADNDPSNAGWQRDLAASLSKMGEVLTAQGKLDDAKAVFEKDLAIAQTLADNDPSNAGWQRDLAASLSKMGEVLTAQGKLDDAKAV